MGLLMLLLLSSSHQSLSGQETQDTLPITVIVKVVDRSTVQPLENVVVRLPKLSLHFLTDSIGQFRLEDVKPGIYRMTLTRQGYRLEEGDFSVDRPGSFQISLSPTEVSADASPGRIIGRVLARESREGIESATVSLVGTASRRETNSTGLFEFWDVPAGHHLLRVEHLGRGSQEDSIFVPESQLLEVEVLLSIDPIPLEGFTVTAHSKWLATSGFFQRREPGYDGRQWDRMQLEESKPVILRDVLETVPGVNQAGLQGYVSRGRCKMTVFVDGIKMDGWYDLDMIQPERVEAMEVFNGRGVTMPIELSRYCGVIMIWLKH